MSSSNRRGIVELNVGGRAFSTTRETLLRGHSSYFHRLLEVPMDDDDTNIVMSGAQTDQQGRLFIDRDPDLFAAILEYL